MKNDNYASLLKRYWGYEDFRGIQRDIIESIGSGHDTLGLMPTGGGKSITFQVPALAMEGVCVVITPLIALMKDQVVHLRRLGIRAESINSDMPHQDILRILENCIFGGVKLLYVSPERLSSSLFQTKLSHMKVSFITVDEAHCISQWGYDFRPSYLEIARIRTLLPDVPVLALTATATPQVVDDIQERLEFREKRVFRMSFARENLSYIVKSCNNKDQELVRQLERHEGSVIIYVRNRMRSRDLAKELHEAGFSTTFYHAGLEQTVKDQRQQDWQQDRVRIIVATNAFGMGIDKPDVRLVIHYDCPDSIEAYFQEAGRAGRDGKPADAVILYTTKDKITLQQRTDNNFPDKDFIRQVYEHLAYYFQIAVGDGYGVSREFDIDKFCYHFHHFPTQVQSSLQILQRAGYLEVDVDQHNQARVHFLIERDDLYRLQHLRPEEDKLIETMLRYYGGLFSDYEYVSELILAEKTGLTTQQIYDILMSLSQRQLLHFIPSRSTPHIRYLQRRVDPEHIVLPHEVYEDRKAQYQARIDAMASYLDNDYECRSRQLLAYFGEQHAKNCGCCDVCQSTDEEPSDADLQALRQQILQLLADGNPHDYEELLAIADDADSIGEVIHELLAEEYIYTEGTQLLCSTNIPLSE